MCYFSAYERLHFHIPLFVAAILMTIGSSVMICYGAARDLRELWIIGIVLGCFALITMVFAFFVLCMLYNPKSWYRRSLAQQHTVFLAPRIYMGPRSVVSYPSAMRVQPPFMPGTSDMGGYRPMVNVPPGSDIASTSPPGHQVYDSLNHGAVGVMISPPSSVLGKDGANFGAGHGRGGPGSLSGSEQGRYYGKQGGSGTMSPPIDMSGRRPLI